MRRTAVPWNLARRISKLRSWLKGSTLDTSRLESSLTEYEMVPQIFTRRLVTSVGVWNQFNGVYEVLSGVGIGWSKFALAIRCEMLHMRVFMDRVDQLSLVDPRAVKRFQLPIVRWHGTSTLWSCMCVLAAVAVHEHESANWCGRRLIKSLVTSDYVCETGAWSECPVTTGLILLIATWLGIDNLPLPKGLELMPPFASIFENWNDNRGFADAVDELCRYHESNCSGNECPFYNPYDVFPAEILALRKIRLDKGLYWPEKIDFRIMETPLCNIPASIPRIPNEYITKVIRKCKTLMPLDIPWEPDGG